MFKKTDKPISYLAEIEAKTPAEVEKIIQAQKTKMDKDHFNQSIATSLDAVITKLLSVKRNEITLPKATQDKYGLLLKILFSALPEDLQKTWQPEIDKVKAPIVTIEKKLEAKPNAPKEKKSSTAAHIPDIKDFFKNLELKKFSKDQINILKKVLEEKISGERLKELALKDLTNLQDSKLKSAESNIIDLLPKLTEDLNYLKHKLYKILKNKLFPFKKPDPGYEIFKSLVTYILTLEKRPAEFVYYLRGIKSEFTIPRDETGPNNQRIVIPSFFRDLQNPQDKQKPNKELLEKLEKIENKVDAMLETLLPKQSLTKKK